MLLLAPDCNVSVCMKIMYLLPNFFTLGNIFCGFYSIIAAINGMYARAAFVLIVAGFFDIFDGKIARATNSSSRFGVEFDSLADLVSFGTAPAILVYLWTLRPLGRMGWLAAFLFVVCGALRLARFNVQADTGKSSKYFIGLPIPAGCGMVASTIIFHDFWFGPELRHPLFMAIMVYLLAVFMVSNLKFRSFKALSIRGKNPFKVMVLASLLLIIVASKPQVVFFLIGCSYIGFGLLENIPGIHKLFKHIYTSKIGTSHDSYDPRPDENRSHLTIDNPQQGAHPKG